MKTRLMQTFIAALVTAHFTSVADARVGGEVGNGGDVVSCTGIDGTAHLFTLDSILAPVQTPAMSLDPVHAIFEVVRLRHPALSLSLYDFVQQIRSENLTGENIWSPVHFGLTDIDDEMVVEKLPAVCGSSSGSAKQWRQAIVQTAVGSKRYYKYDAELLQEIEKSPMQYSQLMIHEWLWRFADNALQVRLANQFLHEAGTATLSAYHFTKFLMDLGLNLPASDPNSGYVIRTEVNERGRLRDHLFDRERPRLYQPIYLEVKNHSSVEFEIHKDVSDGRIDLHPEKLKPGQTLQMQIPMPSGIFLYDRSGGWPAVQSIEIDAPI